jgi:predicted amidophosphoribosyltransferase
MSLAEVQILLDSYMQEESTVKTGKCRACGNEIPIRWQYCSDCRRKVAERAMNDSHFV